MAPEQEIEFLGTAMRSTLSGGDAAVGYRFRVQKSQEVVVWVASLPAKYSREEVERAAQILVRMRMDEGVDPRRVSEMDLDAGAMAGVVKHPSWPQKS
ncbi:MAG TPA: hypothetical protein VJX29_12285 [Candidatus Acidoferrales bacterium]|nr:hypothetical protein [Candidatus Acidoferrales bacterium]